MTIDDWGLHYERYSSDIDITKEHIKETFDYLEKYHNKFIYKKSPKDENIYTKENNFKKIDYSYEYEILKLLNYKAYID